MDDFERSILTHLVKTVCRIAAIAAVALIVAVAGGDRILNAIIPLLKPLLLFSHL